LFPLGFRCEAVFFNPSDDGGLLEFFAVLAQLPFQLPNPR
jgi:hypothetical protein